MVQFSVVGKSETQKELPENEDTKKLSWIQRRKQSKALKKIEKLEKKAKKEKGKKDGVA